MIQGVIFDIDGLMLDAETLAIPAWLKAGTTYDYPIAEELSVDHCLLTFVSAPLYLQALPAFLVTEDTHIYS